jgi:hypothetical protein
MRGSARLAGGFPATVNQIRVHDVVVCRPEVVAIASTARARVRCRGADRICRFPRTPPQLLLRVALFLKVYGNLRIKLDMESDKIHLKRVVRSLNRLRFVARLFRRLRWKRSQGQRQRLHHIVEELQVRLLELLARLRG